MSDKIKFSGTITAVKARIRLLRSFDQVHHAYLGYTLVIEALVDGKEWKDCRVAVGQKTHEKHIFLKGDYISGEVASIEYPEQEWADFYKVSGLKIINRGDSSENRSADMNGGIAPPLSVYRENGHLRLDSKTYEAKCKPCPWGIVMATEIILDHWKPQKKKWRYETHCYGPKDCSNYRPGKPRTVQGRKPGMVWIDDDFERAQSGEY